MTVGNLSFDLDSYDGEFITISEFDIHVRAGSLYDNIAAYIKSGYREPVTLADGIMLLANGYVSVRQSVCIVSSLTDFDLLLLRLRQVIIRSVIAAYPMLSPINIERAICSILNHKEFSGSFLMPEQGVLASPLNVMKTNRTFVSTTKIDCLCAAEQCLLTMRSGKEFVVSTKNLYEAINGKGNREVCIADNPDERATLRLIFGDEEYVLHHISWDDFNDIKGMLENYNSVFCC